MSVRPVRPETTPYLNPDNRTSKNKFQYLFFDLSRGFLSSLSSTNCDCASLAAKIFVLTLPILCFFEAMVDLFALPFIWVANQLCRPSNAPPLMIPPPQALPAPNPIAPPLIVARELTPPQPPAPPISTANSTAVPALSATAQAVVPENPPPAEAIPPVVEAIQGEPPQTISLPENRLPIEMTPPIAEPIGAAAPQTLPLPETVAAVDPAQLPVPENPPLAAVEPQIIAPPLAEAAAAVAAEPEEILVRFAKPERTASQYFIDKIPSFIKNGPSYVAAKTKAVFGKISEYMSFDIRSY